MEQLFFYAFAIVAVISAVCVVTARSAVRSAFFLIICLVQVAALFILLRSPFLAAVQVFVYVGAVMVLFLFAVMVLDIGREQFGNYMNSQLIPAVAVVLGIFVIGGIAVLSGRLSPFRRRAGARLP